MLFGYQWDTSSIFSFAVSILPMLLIGLITTLKAAVVGFFIAMIIGLLLAALKGMPLRIISFPATFIIEFLRDTPLLIQLFFVFYVLPEFTGVALTPFAAGAVALGLQYSAYCAEVYRAGLESVPYGQHEATKALNFPSTYSFFYIILPQAIPRIIPALGNYLVSILKDVPILSVVTVLEMMTVARIIGDRTFNYLVPLTMVGIIYLILTILSSFLIRFIDMKLPKTGIPLK